MVSKKLEMNVELLKDFQSEVKAKNYPLQIHTGIAYTDGNGDTMMPMVIDMPDGFELGRVLNEVIMKRYNLTEY